MIYAQNQVGNMYVLSSTNTASPEIAFNKFYIEYTGPQGAGNGNAKITSDKIDLNCIRYITVKKPQGFTPRTWTITTPTPKVGKKYILYFDFSNWTGFGSYDKYHKFAVAVAATTTKSDLATKLVAAINTQFKHEAYVPFIASISGSNVVLTETSPTVSAAKVLRGIMPSQLDMTISSYTDDEAFSADNGVWASWAEFATTNSNITKADGTPLNNGYIILDMENFYSKNRADLYGLAGYPDCNPSDMVADASKDYYVLTIHYFLQEQGMNNQNSEKQLIVAAETEAALNTLVSGLKTIMDPFTPPATSSLGE